jgi:hypothetical protein
MMLSLYGCGRPHIQRIGNARFEPRSSEALVEVVENTLDRAYEPIALLDSDSYRADNPTSETLMSEDLRRLARKVGADAVHKTRILAVRKRGAVRDTVTPVAGAWIQGEYEEYFMRGEAIRYIKED